MAATNACAEASDPLDARVATKLQILHEQLIKRLSRRVVRRRRLQREAKFEASVAWLGGIATALTLRTPADAASLALGGLSLVASILSAFDMRRIRAFDLEIRSLARAVASLGMVE